MNDAYLSFLDTPIGRLGLIEKQGYIIKISLPNEILLKENFVIKDTQEIIEAKNQINEYFFENRKRFTFMFKQEGSEFRKKVWNQLLEIPYGETRSYKDIAVSIGNPLAARAVGQANNNNNLPIIVPCHRVIGANNSYVGYAGGIDIKKQLLELEKHKI